RYLQDVDRFLRLAICLYCCIFFFFSSRRRHTRFSRDWSSDVCSSDLLQQLIMRCLLERTAAPRRILTQLLQPSAYAAFPRVGRRSEERRVGKECRSRWGTTH